jgi:hypothetical protein
MNTSRNSRTTPKTGELSCKSRKPPEIGKLCKKWTKTSIYKRTPLETKEHIQNRRHVCQEKLNTSRDRRTFLKAGEVLSK